MKKSEFSGLATEAAMLVPLDDAEIEAVICDNRDQLRRHLAVLALNLAANLIDEKTRLVGEPFDTVGDALAAAIVVLDGPFDDERDAIKDTLDRINNNENTILGDECEENGEDEEG